MINMTDYMHRDRLRELWMQIDQLHLSYLQADESPNKIDQRLKLESYIREYLCIVPHDRKFSFRETADVLHRSASTKEDFSGYKAASAWKAIGMYAANLLSQPWRKEYREMKMYCGFFKHEVDANLVGAELMLEAMGYKHIGNTTMVLDGPIDPDRVSNVSRDSLMAAVECQLLKAIWEEVQSRFPCGWLEILEFRENHVGTPENAIRGIVYRFHQRQYQEQQQQQLAAYHHQGQALDNYGTAGRYHQSTPSCLYGQIPSVPHVPHMSYYNYPSYAMTHPHAYTLPAQPRYGTVMSPQQALPPTMPYPIPAPVHAPYLPASVHPILKSQDIYGTSAHNAVHQYQAPPLSAAPPAHIQSVPVSVQNGYTTASQMATGPTVMPNYNCPVPTGQLIELDAAPPPASSGSETQQGCSATDSSSSVLIPRTVRQHQSHHMTTTKRSNSDKQHDPQFRNTMAVDNYQSHNYDSPRPEAQQLSSSKAKDDGMGTFASWDFVFRNLESQGYSKDLGERPDILSPPFENQSGHKKATTNDGRHPRQQHVEPPLELETKLMEMRLEEFNRKAMANPSEHRPMKINEALRKINLESSGDVSHGHMNKNIISGDIVDGNGSVYDNMSSPPKESATRQRPLTLSTGPGKSNNGVAKLSTKTLLRDPRKHGAESKRSMLSSSHYSSATLDPKHLTDRNGYNSSLLGVSGESSLHEKSASHRDSVTKSRINDKPIDRKETTGDVIPLLNNTDNGEKWQCETCTFLNSASVEICEMCGKSKTKGSESHPLASGGRECPKCTLVNEKGVSICVACDHSLKDSPTYI
ncbi:protein tamozhennic [Anabrus simplex]|uniref:protein tamozhennic n=1 Tax=Anabrus simplex TaxID=316456 RepID=UPI0035A3C036